MGGDTHAAQAERLCKEAEVLLACGFTTDEILITVPRDPTRCQAVVATMHEERKGIHPTQEQPRGQDPA